MRRLWRENGLSIVTLALFLLFVGGQTAAGWHDYNQDQEEHGQPALGYVEYLGSGHSIEALSENAESEFLQMGLFVWLTTFLRQKGSPESKALGPEEVDKDPRRNRERGSPWPVQRGGFALTLYENSLTLVFLALFLVAFSSTPCPVRPATPKGSSLTVVKPCPRSSISPRRGCGSSHSRTGSPRCSPCSRSLC